MFNRFFIFLFAIILINACRPSLVVTHVTQSTKNPSNNGFYYNLPQTAITIDVTVKKKISTEGQFAPFAEQMLGIKNSIFHTSTEYQLDAVKINSTPVRDPDQFYFVEIKKTLFSSPDLKADLNENGSINSFNKKISAKSNLSKPIIHIGNPDESEAVQLHNIIHSNMNIKIDTLIEKVITDTAILDKQILKQKVVEKSLEQKAREAADFLLKLKKDRYELISGQSEVNYEKGSIEIMNNELLKMENEYLNLFTGKTQIINEHYSFTYIPDKNYPTYIQPILRFAANKGILTNDSVNGNPVFIRIQKINDMYPLDSSVIERNKNKKYNHGLFYRIPCQANVEIIFKNEIITGTEMLINQFGQITNIDIGENKVKFFPNSGALKSIETN